MEGIYVHPLGSFTQLVILKVAGIKELYDPNTEEQWVIKLPQFQLLERVHLLIEIVAYTQRYSLIHHARVGKHRRYSF